MDRLDDSAVYRRLLAMCDELSELADRCWSPGTATVITWLATVARNLAAQLRSPQGR